MQLIGKGFDRKTFEQFWCDNIVNEAWLLKVGHGSAGFVQPLPGNMQSVGLTLL